MAFLLIAGFFSAAIGLNAGAPSASAQAAGSSLADAVPDYSVLYMEIELDQQSAQWAQTFDLLDRAGLSELVEEEADASPEQLAQVAEAFEVTGKAAMVFPRLDLDSASGMGSLSNEASSITTDPLSVADSDIPEGFAVIFQPEDPDALYANLRQVVADEADENLATVETTDYNGVTIEYWESTDGMTEPTAVAQLDGLVVLAVNPVDIEPIVDTVNGDVDSLGSTEGFTAVRDALAAESLVFGYVSTEEVFNAAIVEEPSLAGTFDQFAGFAGWTVWADDAGFRLDTIQVPAEGADLPDLSTFTPSLADKVSADSLLFVSANDLTSTGIFDLLGIGLQEAFGGMDSGAGTATDLATPTVDEVYAQLESQLGFNPKTDLFDQLTGEYGLALEVQDVFSGAPDINAVFVSDVDDEMKVADAVSKISFILTAGIGEEAEVSTRDVTGGTVTSIVIPDQDLPITIEYGVIAGQLLFGVNNGIDEYLDGPTASLADDPIYQDTMAALPQENLTGVQYLNLGQVLAIIEEGASTFAGSMSMVDADEACGDYATQAEAQEALDEDPAENWMLDTDFDGEACEDFFGAGTGTEASPASVTDSLNLLSVGSVSYSEGDNLHSSTILLIGK